MLAVKCTVTLKPVFLFFYYIFKTTFKYNSGMTCMRLLHQSDWNTLEHLKKKKVKKLTYKTDVKFSGSKYF